MIPHPMTQASEAAERPWAIGANATSNYGCEIVANTKVKAKRVVCRLGGPIRDENAALIVTAVNDRDSLLAQVEELKADNARLREALTDARDWHEQHDKALSKSGRSDADYHWRRNQHQEQRDALNSAHRPRSP